MTDDLEFWLVWCPGWGRFAGTDGPLRYFSEASAERAAEAIAADSPGLECFTLHAVSRSVATKPITVTRLLARNEVVP